MITPRSVAAIFAPAQAITRVVTLALALGSFAVSAAVLRTYGISGAYTMMRLAKVRRPWIRVSESFLAAQVDACAAVVSNPTWCLSRSVALASLLRLFGVPASVVLGIRPLPLAGHAWVEVKGRVVNDDARVARYYRKLDTL